MARVGISLLCCVSYRLSCSEKGWLRCFSVHLRWYCAIVNLEQCS